MQLLVEANANTYITLADANSFIEGLVLSDDAAAWDGSSNDNKNRALFTAAQRIDREKFFRGAGYMILRHLNGLRTGVRKPDTYVNTYAVGLSFSKQISQQIISQIQKFQISVKRCAGNISCLFE